MTKRSVALAVIAQTIVLVTFCNIRLTSAAPVKSFGILAAQSMKTDLNMGTVEPAPSRNETNSTGDDPLHESYVPRWYVWCVGCGAFVGGIGVSVTCCGIRSRWRTRNGSSGDNEGCVVIPNKLNRKIPQVLHKNLKNTIHRIPDIFAPNGKRGFDENGSPVDTKKARTNCEKSSSHLQRLLSTQTTYSGENLPFVTQFSDIVTSEGGEILSPDSDVSVIIPPGAIPDGRMQLVYVNVSLSLPDFGVSTGPTEYQLTPVVECLAPGLDRFLLPVTVKIPHRADITIPANPWQFNVRYSQSPVGKEMNWYRVASGRSSNQNSDVTYTHDADFVYIRTNHFTSFTCTGCGKRAHPPLKLSAVIYGNEKSLHGKQQVNLRVYISDASTDVQKRITSMERSYNGSQLSQFKPLSVHNSKDWEVELTSVRDDCWPWKLLHNEEKTKTIPMDVCYHCCSSPPSVDFRVVPKDDGVRLGDMESTFNVSQIRRRREDMVFTQLVTHDFTFQEDGSADYSGSDVSASAAQIDTRHINYIKRHLLPRDMPNVARALQLTDVDIETIKRDFHDSSVEQIHQMIALWMVRKGRAATCRAFCESLEQEEMREIAEGLRRVDLNCDL